MTGEGKSSVFSAKLILRLVELVFSIITFAVIAEWSGWDSKVNFTLFTGITTMIFCLAFSVLYIVGIGDSPAIALIELIFNVVWWIFWIATAACLSDIVSSLNSYGVGGDADRFRASCAFAWLTFFLWTLSTALSIMTLLKGRRSAGPSVPPVAEANVAMV